MSDRVDGALPEHDPVSSALAEAIGAVESAPERADRWDSLDEVLASEERPELVAALMLRLLQGPDATIARASFIGQRGIRFFQEWFEDPIACAPLLHRVLEIDPHADWAFLRLTLSYTRAKRWPELLALYDAALERNPSTAARARILDEAAQVARELASDPDRAIRYLEQLLPLRPTDTQLAAALERLLERQARHHDLIKLWTARLPALSSDASAATRLRIAGCWLDAIGDAPQALDTLEPLFGEAPADSPAITLAGRVLRAASAPIETRARARDLMLSRLSAEQANEKRGEVLEQSLEFVRGAERARTLDELISLLESRGAIEQALGRAAELLALTPDSPQARARLAALAQAADAFGVYADALAQAADALEAGGDVSDAVDLRLESARLRAERLGDDVGAAEAYERVDAVKGATDAQRLEATAALEALYDRGEDRAKLLSAIERRAGLEPEGTRVECLRRAARLAQVLAEPARSLASWEGILTRSPQDRDALDASVALLEELARWRPLVGALQRRAEAISDPSEIRADLVRAARILERSLEDFNEAIDAWTVVGTRFGRNDEVIDALANLHERIARWDELAALLEGAIEPCRDAGRRADLLARLGVARMDHLADPEGALAAFSAALHDRPALEIPRARVSALMNDPRTAARATEALAEAFAVTDEWEARLDLLEARLSHFEPGAPRAQLLLDAARTREARAGDIAGALGDTCRAFIETPSDHDVERSMLDLAERAAGYPAVAEAYRSAIARAPELETSLRMRCADVLEHKVQDLDGALELYRAVFDGDVTQVAAATATVRVGAAVGDWSLCARVVVRVAIANGEDTGLLQTLERGALAADGWSPAADAMSAAIADAGPQGTVAHDLEARVGGWFRDHVSDLDRAQSSYERAVAHDRTSHTTLTALADLQRRAPSSALIDTLLKLSAVSGDDLSPLREAAEVAVGPGSDPRADEILRQLHERAGQRWIAGAEGSQADVEWSLERLVERHLAARRPADAVPLLQAAAALPFATEQGTALLRRAASLCEGELADDPRAIGLYRAAFERSATDRASGARLAVLYERGGDLEALADLRRSQIDRADVADERLALRLDLARVLSLLDDGPGCERVLRDNLSERPGHAETVRLLAARIEDRGALQELLALYQQQASAVESEDRAGAQRLWTAAALLAERSLGDVEQAIAAHARVVELGLAPRSLDALAALHTQRGEHAAAVQWLERRLAVAESPEDRAAIVALLAAGQTAAGHPDRAIEALERQLLETPGELTLHRLLAEHYRAQERWLALAELLCAGAGRGEDDKRTVEALREAAEVFTRRLSMPERAVPVLEQAVALAPADRPLRVALADARCDTGDLDGARSLLEASLGEYGRRRPPERAKVHRALARIARSQGQLQSALAQLELAADIDLDDPRTLEMVGDVALELGEYERAASALRSLLLLVRRQPELEGPSQAEVLFALYRIAIAEEQRDRAAEFLESAFEVSAVDEGEARRFERALAHRGERELLLRALRARLARATDPRDTAAILDQIAATLEALGRGEQALDARLGSLESAATLDEAAHRATRALAHRLGATDRYVRALRALAARATETHLAGALLLMAGEATAEDLDDPRGAVADLEQAHLAGAPERDVLRALDRAYVAARAAAPLRAVLARRAEPDGPEDDEASRIDALFRLAELDLERAETSETGVETLERALEVDARYERACRALARAARLEPVSPAVLALYERSARALGEDSTLLDALDRATTAHDSAQELLREAVELAERLGETDRERALLERAIARGDDPTDAVWALVALGRIERDAGSVERAVELLSRAAAHADLAEAVQLGSEAAALAAGLLDDLRLAAQILDALHERDPAERVVWEQLLAAYRQLDDDRALAARIQVVIEHVYEIHERNALRVERARILAKSPDTLEEAVASLRVCLDDDPSDAAATGLLADLLSEAGRDGELDEFLRWQLDGALDRGDGSAIVALSMRLASRWGPERRDEVIALYRRALDWAPSDTALLRALLAQYDDGHDPDARLEVLARLLDSASGEQATPYALALADAYAERGDQEAATGALQRGFRADPTSDALRDKLEHALRTSEDWPALAEFLALDAEHRDRASAVARLREAASVHRDTLGDIRAAAACLERARLRDPRDRALIEEHAADLSAADDHEGAALALSAAVDLTPEGSLDEARLRVAWAASLRAAGALDRGVDQLERALTLDPDSALEPLLDALESLRARAADAGDAETERRATMRLAILSADHGGSARACEALEAWVAREPSDRDALRQLATLHADAGRWDAVPDVYRRLVAVTDGDERVEAVLRLVEACERAEQLGDARAELEATFRAHPENEPVRAWLRRVYTALHAHGELAELSLEDARHAPGEAIRFDRLRQAGRLFVQAERFAEAVEPLSAALQLRQGDHESTIGLVDAHLALGNIEVTSEILQTAINGHRNRRSAELAALQFRMSRAALAVGDQDVQLAWLNAALESDHQNGLVASELAELAMAREDFETASRALRALTLMKSPGPMSKAYAFYLQGVVASRLGDPRKAAFLAKRALSEDPELAEARALLAQIGE